MIDQFKARYHLSRTLGERGAILYSSFLTLSPRRFYILGLNPGGTPGSGDTIAQRLNGLSRHKGNAHIDEDWRFDSRHYGIGEHPLQRHLRMLMQELGEDLRHVWASNLIFARSPDQYSADYPERRHLCWPVHQMIMNIVRPNVIIAFGNGNVLPYAFLALKYQETLGEEPEETRFAAQHGPWQCRSLQTWIESRPTLVIGLPHLSRYTIEGKPAGLDWIKEKIRKHNKTPQQRILICEKITRTIS